MTPSDVSKWLSTATDLKGKFAEMQQRMNALKNSSIDAGKYPQLAKERQDLIAKGNKLLSTVKSTVESVDAAYDYVKNINPMDNPVFKAGEYIGEKIGAGAGAAWDWFKTTTGLNGLGIIPVIIAVGVVGSAAAAITYWITDSIDLQAKISEQKRLEAKGVPPEQASRIVARMGSNAFTKFVGNLGTTGKLVGVAGILFGGYKLLESYRKTRRAT